MCAVYKLSYLFWEYLDACTATHRSPKCKCLWGVVHIGRAWTWVLSFENWPLKHPGALLFLRHLKLCSKQKPDGCTVFLEIGGWARLSQCLAIPVTGASCHFSDTREEMTSFVESTREQCWICEANDLPGVALKFHPTESTTNFIFVIE